MLGTWAKKAKLSFAPNKTVSVQFKGTLRSRYMVLRIAQDAKIRFSNSVKFLGVILDKKRLYIEHAYWLLAKPRRFS